MNTMRVTKIAKDSSSQFSVIVSDGQELFREGPEAHEEFLEKAEEFLKESYGGYISILHRETIVLEHNGSAFFTLQSITDGIMQNIAEDFGLQVEEIQRKED